MINQGLQRWLAAALGAALLFRAGCSAELGALPAAPRRPVIVVQGRGTAPRGGVTVAVVPQGWALI